MEARKREAAFAAAEGLLGREGSFRQTTAGVSKHN